MTAPRARQVYADNCGGELTPWLLRVPDGAPPDARRIFVPAWIVRAPEWQALGATERVVLLAIRGWSDRRGRAQVAFSQLVGETGFSESTVIAAVKDLERAGWLVVTRERIAPTRNAVNVYQLAYPGEADLIRRAVDRAVKEGPGSRTDARVRPTDVYVSGGTRRERKAFLHSWEFDSTEWQALMTSPNALDEMIVLRAHAIDGTVGMSKLQIARAAGKGGEKARSRARARTRVLESTSALVKLGVLKVVRRGGPRGHQPNLYAPCIPPSCARWAAFWQGSAPGAAAVVTPPKAPAPSEVLRFPGVRVTFHPGSKVAPGAPCTVCARPASAPRRHIHRPSDDPWSWTDRYCAGAHAEPIVAGCPDCGAPVGADGDGVVLVEASAGTCSCSACGATHRFADPWNPADLSSPDPSEAWLPMDADRLVRVWLEGRRDKRAPVPAEVALVERLIVETGDWWAVRLRVMTEWKRHATKDTRYLTGLAQRAGGKPDTS